MDDIDRRILEALQDNARIPLKTIAQNTFLSSPAVSARVTKMEKKGIITGYHASVDIMKLDYTIIAYISLKLDKADKARFYEYMEGVCGVMDFSCITGEYSILIKIAFKTTMELEDFVRSVQTFGETDTQILLSSPFTYRGIRAN